MYCAAKTFDTQIADKGKNMSCSALPSRLGAHLSGAFLFAWLGYGLACSNAVAQPPSEPAAPPSQSPEPPAVPAQPAPTSPEQAPPAAPVITPPSLLQFVEAPYPEEARALGLSATVEISLVVTIDGSVEEPSVVAPQGHGFDEAALEAVRQFRFAPATRDGVPARARIRYAYVFELREELVAPEPQASEPTEPLEAAPNVEPLEPSEPAAEPEPEVDAEAFGTTARVSAPPREATRRTLDDRVLTRIPGTRGDPLRAVELLPGIARPPSGAGVLIVRGSSPRDTQTYLDGVPVPLLYHFGGLTSFYSWKLIDRVEFYPGNFSVRYGRKFGGALDVRPRDPKTDGFHGMADINIIDASMVAEGPITDGLSVAVGARRSYIDAFFENVVPEGTFDVVAAPVYWDYQSTLTWRPTEHDRVRLMGYGSSDEFKVILSDPPDGEPAIQGNLALVTGFHKAHAAWRHEYSPQFVQDIDVAVGETSLRFAAGPNIRFELTTIPVDFRSEWRYRFSDMVSVTAGMDITYTPYDITFVGPQPGQNEGDPAGGMSGQDPLATRDILRIAASGQAYRPALYVETAIRPIDPLQIVIGGRLDYSRDIKGWSFDPRMTARYEAFDGFTIKGGVGLFSQPPDFAESSEQLGNPNLGFQSAIHLELGVEEKFNDVWEADLSGFYKDLNHRVVSADNDDPRRYTNDGVGRIYGMELGVRANPKGRFFGFLSYTLSRSERNDRNEGYRLFDFDQTHILTVAGVVRLGRGWEIGGTFRLTSGNPYTPITQAIYDASADVYQPLYGDVNSERNPYFHRLDVRVEKLWKFDAWKLSLYLDVQNVYNSSVREGVFYNYNFSESGDIPGLPIIPSLGLRGEL